jgi:ATP-dependent Clp protease ATP-binding subunit ClpA
MPNQNQIERFTERARRVMTLAQEEATNLRHPKIEPEHFLLAMLRDSVSIGGRTLIELGLGYNQLQTIIGNIQVETFTDAPLDLSDETKRLLENAIGQSRRLGHPQVGTEHLLLGLAHGKNRAVEILAELGVSPEEIQRYTRRVMQEPRQQPLGSGDMPEALKVLQSLIEAQSSLNPDRLFYSWMVQQYHTQINEVLTEMGADVDDFWKRIQTKFGLR